VTLSTDVNRLLARQDRMTHQDRARQIVEHGRRSGSDPRLAATLDALGRGSFSERRLALIACHGSRDGQHVMRATSDPSSGIRDLALRWVSVLCDDDQALAALELLDPRRRRRLAARLARRRRRGVVDRFVARGALARRELLEILPFASGATVAGHLDLFDDASDLDWKRLASHHPELVTRRLLKRVRTAGVPGHRLVWQVGGAVVRLAKRDSAAALDLLRALATRVPLSDLDLQRLLPIHAAAVADIALASRDDARVSFGPAIDRLDGPRLAALAFRLPGARPEITRRFRHLSPETRDHVYRAVGVAWRTTEGSLDLEIVRWLSRPAREEEALRHLELPALATQPARRLPYVALLGWDRALGELASELGSPDPELRSLAVAALVSSVRHQRERAADLIDFLRRRRHEQDPVRAAFLGSLARLPPTTWQAEHLPGLSGVVRDALDASDLSQGSVAALAQLATRLFQRQPEWAAATLADLARERGYLAAYDLGWRISDHHLDHLVPRLLPVLRTWNGRSRELQVIQAARSLGPRLRASPELGELLERLLLTTRSSEAAAGCLSLLRGHQPERFAGAAVQLLRKDESAILLGHVADHVSRERQDLLLPFLEPRTYSGRFSSSKAPLVLSFRGGFQRWTGAQEAKFARALETLTRRDPTRDTPTIVRALRQLADLHLEPPARLVQMTQTEHPALREAALRLLGSVDRLDLALPVLLTTLGDDRGRIAVYALRRALLAIPPAAAVSLLAAAPLDRVTVAKEVVRLLGELPAPEALAELLRLGGHELHRDVRTALLRALWGHLDQPAAWEVLETAAESPDPAIARSLVRIPAAGLDGDGQRRLVALVARLTTHPDAAVRVAVAGRCALLPIPDPDGAMIGALLPLLSSRLPDERSAAGAAVFALAGARDADRLAESVRHLLPDRRALSAAVDQLSAAVPWARSRLAPVAIAVLAELARDPLAAPLELELAARTLSWPGLGERLRRWAAEGHLDGDLLAGAVATLGRPTVSPQRAEVEGLAELEADLSAADEPRLRRLGLATLVGLASTPGGWSRERLDRLRVYRADASALVAGPAQFTFPPGDPEAEPPAA
jgi:hypothetical protein